MNLTKPTHIAFVVASIVTVIVSVLCEKIYLIYAHPFTVIAILLIYLTEKQQATSMLYVLSQLLFLVGCVLLILGMRHHLRAVSVVFSVFYIFYLRLMYLRNTGKKASIKTYAYLLIFTLPVLYIYYKVIQIISSEIKHVAIYFGILMFFMLSYVITAVYYYLRDKSSQNLWMLIAAMNLGFMNILVGLNELYMYETIFTVIVIICSFCFQWFVLKFMLPKELESYSIFEFNELDEM
ncbi:hypothetical protein [Kordia zhangzhouensis]|uniref:hypothetical protein n=1 Tax=Kordia zhangzhouensis TaxID=1620405 RepID=UPI0006295AE0|nr:hypothetical protein [Kordia zhangzhouensis]